MRRFFSIRALPEYDRQLKAARRARKLAKRMARLSAGHKKT